MSKISREQVGALLTAFLQRELGAQGGKKLRLSSNINSRIVQLAGNNLGASMELEAWLKTKNSVSDIPGFVSQVMRRLPSSISQKAADRLKLGSGDKPPGTLKRLTDHVKGTEPAGEPESVLKMRHTQSLTSSERVERFFGEPKGEVILTVPVGRAVRILVGLPDALSKPKSKKKRPEARTPDGLEQVFNRISSNALTPTDARGTHNAGNYADARQFARTLARELDIHHQQGKTSFSMDLGVSYRGINNLGSVYEQLAKIHKAVRAVLPENASKVKRVQINFGNKPATALTYGK